MTGNGRPLRFLALVLSGWIGLRVLLLWPDGATLPQAIRAALPLPAALEPEPVAQSRPGLAVAKAMPPVAVAPVPAASPLAGIAPVHRAMVHDDRVRLALLALVRFGPAELVQIDPPVAMPPRLREPLRTTVSVWALARPGAATGGPVQLGGGQAGARVRMPVAGGGRAALAGRLSSPLAGPGREAALGIEWRPTDAPLAFVVERRIALDRSRSGTGVGMIGGIDRRGVIAGFDLEAYGQAGAVARAGTEPYADGAVRGLTPTATLGRAVLKLGVGGWGGAQRGATRLDIGPSAVVALPVAGRPVRLSIDWRQRVAGNAAPGSGPAVTLGSDF